MNSRSISCRMVAAGLLGLLLFLLMVVPVRAQDRTYRIGPRDVISLSIYAGGELQQQVDLTVSESGSLNVPFVGQIAAGGLSGPELEKRIRDPLAADYFVDPEVNVIVKDYRRLQYYISGAVKEPGEYSMSSETTLLELIAKAGGVTPDRGNVAYILRAAKDAIKDGENLEALMTQKEPIRANLICLLDQGDMSCNPQLQSGDVVYIPLEKTLNSTEHKIFVEGEVENPGIYDYQPGVTALTACIMAGGFAKFAAPSRARIIRMKGGEQTVIKIDLEKVKEGDLPDVELLPGDRIHVPETWL